MRRALVLSSVVGVVVAITVVAIVYALLVIPFYALAQIEPGSGMDRPFVRDGILRFALPAGVLLGAACGAVVGVWHARGGRLPTE